jgi:hypothetical protein
MTTNTFNSINAQRSAMASWKIIASLALIGSSGVAHPALALPQGNANLPTVATLQKLVNGDLKCYVTLADSSGKKFQEVGATFRVCETAKPYLNQRVTWQYGLAQVNDCQSSEPCGRTRTETLITQMQLNSEPPAPQVSLIGKQEKTRSYNLTISGKNDILFVRCPQNSQPKLGYLRNVEALQCE